MTKKEDYYALYKDRTAEELIDELIFYKHELELNHHTKTILANLPAVISRFDKNYICVYVNKATEELLQCPASEIVGKTLIEMNIRQKFRLLWTKQLRTAFSSQQPVSFFSKVRSFFGEEIFYHALFVPEYDRNTAEVTHILCTAYDITTIKKAETIARLQLAGAIAGAIGHEIRNPLTTVKGYLQFLSHKVENTTLYDSFQLMLSEVENSNNAITKLLSITHDPTPLARRQCLDNLLNRLNKT